MKHIKNSLNDNVILVTGAGNGIGSAVAKAYGEHGASVILLDKDVPALERTYDEITASSNNESAIYPLDLKGATLSDYQTLVSTIETTFGRLDGLTHCAASLGQVAPMQLQSPTTWLETLHINLTAPYLLTQACLKLLTKQQHASVIFTTDQHKDSAYWSAYGISKGAIETLCQQLADEFESDGRIKFNCIDPGLVKTALHQQAFPASDPSLLAAPAEIVAAYLQLMNTKNPNDNGKIIQAQ